MTKNNKTIKPNFVRENNVKVIIDLLSEKPASCLEIANQIRISDVGANKIIKQLLSLNMVKKASEHKTEKKIGGQHIRYTLNENIGLYICVDFTEFVNTAYIYDFADNLIKVVKFNISYYALVEEVEEAIKILKDTLNQLLPDYNNRILGIGVAVPGQVNKNTNGFLESGKFKNFKENELYEMLKKEFNTYIIVRHNVQLMAIGESYKGKLNNHYDIATYVYAGNGLAACVMFEGKNVSGWRGYAGEIADNKIYPEQTLSHYCSLRGILNKIQETRPEITIDDLFELYKTDEEFHAMINESAIVMAMFMNNVTNLLGCNLFMVSGRTLEFGDEYLNIIKEYLRSHSSIKIEVIKSSLDNAAVMGSMKLLKDFVITDYYKTQIQLNSNNENF